MPFSSTLSSRANIVERALCAQSDQDRRLSCGNQPSSLRLRPDGMVRPARAHGRHRVQGNQAGGPWLDRGRVPGRRSKSSNGCITSQPIETQRMELVQRRRQRSQPMTIVARAMSHPKLLLPSLGTNRSTKAASSTCRCPIALVTVQDTNHSLGLPLMQTSLLRTETTCERHPGPMLRVMPVTGPVAEAWR